MFICSECGYKNNHKLACCLVCGSLAKHSTSILSGGSPEAEVYIGKFGSAIADPDIKLTLSIKHETVVTPFPKGAELVLGRQIAEKRNLLATNLEPEQEQRPVVIMKGVPIILDEPPSFLSLNAFEAEQAGVSRQHLKIRHEEHFLTIEDLNSTNGTRLNGQRVVPGDKRLLRHGDEIRLGSLSIVIGFNRETALAYRPRPYSERPAM